MIHPDEVLTSLKAQSNTRMGASLDILHEVCRDLKTGGSVDFSLPTIGILLLKRKGPSYQTLRNNNPQGKRYRTLIQSWSRLSGGSTKKPGKSTSPQAFDILDKIVDPAVRGIVGGIIAENSKFRGEIHLLRQKVDYVIDRRPVEITQQYPRVEILPAPDHLTKTEVDALCHAISEKLIQAEGWVVDDNGRIKTMKGRTIFKPGFVTAIRKMLETGRY